MRSELGWRSYRDFCKARLIAPQARKPENLEDAWWQIEYLEWAVGMWRRHDASQRGVITRLKNRRAYGKVDIPSPPA